MGTELFHSRVGKHIGAASPENLCLPLKFIPRTGNCEATSFAAKEKLEGSGRGARGGETRSHFTFGLCSVGTVQKNAHVSIP